MAKTTLIPEADEELALEYEGAALDGAETILQELDPERDLLSQAGYPMTRDVLAVRQAADPKTMSATFCIVTRTKETNRHGNMVQIAAGPNGKGLDVQAYTANPIVLFEHGMGLALPIGSAQSAGKLSLTLQKSKAVSTCYFSQTLADAAVIFGLVDEDILRMASVQFCPRKAMRISPNQEKLGEGVESCNWGGYDFVESELLEWSIVCIGADPGALRKSIDRGKINGYRIGPALKQGLSVHAEKPKILGVGASFPPPQAPTSKDDNAELVSTIKQFLKEIQDHRAEVKQQAVETIAPPAPVDTILQDVKNVPIVTGEQLANAYRQQATQESVTQALARQLPGLIRQEVEKITQPIVEQHRKLNERIAQVAGRA